MNENEFYKKIKDWDFNEFQIESEKFTNWNMYEILQKITNKNSKILDLGTGGGEKLLKYFPEVKEILGTDNSEEMIETAINNLRLSGRKNINFRVMNNLEMDVPDNYYEVVVARNTIIDPKQIYKVLKNNGYILVHGVDKYDCHELKRIFGYGQGYYDNIPISIIDYENILDAGFKDVELIPLHVIEYFKSKELFKKFLLKVPILNDFSEEQNENKEFYDNEIDEEKLNTYIEKNTYSKGIKLVRRYYGISGKK